MANGKTKVDVEVGNQSLCIRWRSMMA